MDRVSDSFHIYDHQHMAASHGHEECIWVLLRHGCNVHLRGKRCLDSTSLSIFFLLYGLDNGPTELDVECIGPINMRVRSSRDKYDSACRFVGS